MARVRSPARDEAFEIYKKNNGEITLREIAKQLDVPEKSISGWKVKDKWNDKINGVLHKNKQSTPKQKEKNVNKKSSKKEPIADEIKKVLGNTELTEKQRLFCIYYIENFNATKAYKKAYACSYDTAKVEGCKSLTKPNIKKEIQRLTKECLEEEEVEAKLLNKRLFETYMKIAFSDVTDYLSFGRKEIKVFSDDGPETIEVNYVDFKESTEVDGSIISEIKQGKDGVSIKLQDKMKAMEFLAKYSGLLDTVTKEKLEIEKQKLEIAKIKSGAYEEEEEVEDDGFIEALGNKVAEVWADEEDS